MRSSISQIFAGILLLATIATAEEPSDGISTSDTSLTFRPHPRLSTHQFVLEGLQEFSAAEISVFRIAKGKKTQVQTLLPSKPLHKFELADGRAAWRVEDLNFDGYLDVGLRWSRGATGNTLYYYWIYDPTTGRFDFNEQLSGLMNIDLQKERQVLVSRAMHRFGYEEYKFQNGRFVRVKKVTEEEGLKANADAH